MSNSSNLSGVISIVSSCGFRVASCRLRRHSGATVGCTSVIPAKAGIQHSALPAWRGLLGLQASGCCKAEWKRDFRSWTVVFLKVQCLQCYSPPFLYVRHGFRCSPLSRCVRASPQVFLAITQVMPGQLGIQIFTQRLWSNRRPEQAVRSSGKAPFFAW